MPVVLKKIGSDNIKEGILLTQLPLKNKRIIIVNLDKNEEYITTEVVRSLRLGNYFYIQTKNSKYRLKVSNDN